MCTAARFPVTSLRSSFLIADLPVPAKALLLAAVFLVKLQHAYIYALHFCLNSHNYCLNSHLPILFFVVFLGAFKMQNNNLFFIHARLTFCTSRTTVVASKCETGAIGVIDGDYNPTKTKYHRNQKASFSVTRVMSTDTRRDNNNR